MPLRESAKQCTAIAKSTREQCKNPAVTGYGVCRLHGAGVPARGTSGGRPVTHGRYSFKYQQSLSNKVKRFESFQGDLQAELAVLRALLQEFMDKIIDGGVGAGEVAVVRDMVEAIARTEERLTKIHKDTAFGAQEMQLFIAAMSSVLQKYVPDDDLPDAISDLRSILSSS